MSDDTEERITMLWIGDNNGPAALVYAVGVVLAVLRAMVEQ
jgi:hypothetical protein